MGEKVYCKRQFLNDENDGGIALVRASVDEATVNDDGYVNFDAELTIGDCSRQITLDFSVYGSAEKIAEEIANRRTKLRRLRQALTAFDHAVTVQLDEIESRL